MRLGYWFSLLLALPISLAPIQLSAQELSAQPGSGSKVCVAVVTNQTAEPLDQDRMTARLVHALTDKKLTVTALDSSTGNSRDLRPTLENSSEMKDKECDYLVLTQVSNPKDHPTELHSPQISIGGRVPSTDASDRLGREAAYRDNLEINFAVFRPGNAKALLDTRILDRPSANVSDSLMQAMDREGGRISHDLKKK
jgi:hypothetical protein